MTPMLLMGRTRNRARTPGGEARRVNARLRAFRRKGRLRGLQSGWLGERLASPRRRASRLRGNATLRRGFSRQPYQIEYSVAMMERVSGDDEQGAGASD